MGRSGDEKGKMSNRDTTATQKSARAGSQCPSRAAGHRGVIMLPKPRSQGHPARARTRAEAAQQAVRPWREGWPQAEAQP